MEISYPMCKSFKADLAPVELSGDLKSGQQSISTVCSVAPAGSVPILQLGRGWSFT